MFFSMGEVTEMFDVNASLIRFWEKRFSVLKPHKNNKGNRMFTPADIENLKLIYHLVREKGMTLDGAAKYINDNKNSDNRDIRILDHLGRIRAALLSINQELGSVESDTEIVVRTPTLSAKTSDNIAEDLPPSAAPESAAEPTQQDPPTPRYIEPTLFDLL